MSKCSVRTRFAADRNNPAHTRVIEVNDAHQSVPSEHDLDELYGNLRSALTGSANHA